MSEKDAENLLRRVLLLIDGCADVADDIRAYLDRHGATNCDNAVSVEQAQRTAEEMIEAAEAAELAERHRRREGRDVQVAKLRHAGAAWREIGEQIEARDGTFGVSGSAAQSIYQAAWQRFMLKQRQSGVQDILEIRTAWLRIGCEDME